MKRACFAALMVLICLIALAPSANSLVFDATFPSSLTFMDVIAWIAPMLQPPVMAPAFKAPVVADEEAQAVLLPLPGHTITSAFGPRMHPIFKREIFHEGIDIAARKGDPVRCVLDGIVISACRHGGFGNAVYVFHPTAAAVSMYAHLSQLNVTEGETIRQGTIVGLAGSTGFSTGVHLHFGVKTVDGHWTDPLCFLRDVPQYEAEAVKLRATAYGGDLESPDCQLPGKTLSESQRVAQNSVAGFAQ